MSPKTSERNRLPPLSETEKLEALARGVREFNSWRFYDCHETLEDVWRAEASDLADFFQGIIKVAAGFHHLLRGEHKGAVNLLGHALTLLAPYRPACLGLDVQRLIDETSACYKSIRELGADRIGEFDRSTLPSIAMEGQ
jgi:predicted metal-dependent hydrolase